MLAGIRDNTAALEAISRDSRRQASAIDEVNIAVRTMDEMTQHNAALVEETNAAIEQTEAQASELDRIVDIFKLANAPVRLVTRPTLVAPPPAASAACRTNSKPPPAPICAAATSPRTRTGRSSKGVLSLCWLAHPAFAPESIPSP